MASKKELFKKKAQEMTHIHNTPKPTSLGAFNDVERVKNSIEIITELQEFIRPLTKEQYTQLEQNIIQHGCQDALVLWETTEYELGRGENETPVYILVDGHNRYAICKANKIDFKITLKVFVSIDDVKDYMIDLQIGRRNLSLEEESYYRGLKYNAQKRNRGIILQASADEEPVINVAENLALTYNVSSRTIKNDGKFADGMSKLSKSLREEILQGVSKISRKDIQSLSNEIIAKDSIDSLDTLNAVINKGESITISIEEPKLLLEIKKLSQQLKTPQSCDILIEKISLYKSFLQK
ncbi:MAG: hypothetical protein MUF58_19040 [Arcicella sp.]|jgi:hypothetical protein|nr:hypothetical protein [Arcicella sp.]